MNLENFKQAIKGQKTVRLEFPHLSCKLEVSDIKVGESGLLIYTYWDFDVCREVLTRVSEVIEVKSVCTIEEWNASQSAWDVLHDMHGLRGF